MPPQRKGYFLRVEIPERSFIKTAEVSVIDLKIGTIYGAGQQILDTAYKRAGLRFKPARSCLP